MCFRFDFLNTWWLLRFIIISSSNLSPKSFSKIWQLIELFFHFILKIFFDPMPCLLLKIWENYLERKKIYIYIYIIYIYILSPHMCWRIVSHINILPSSETVKIFKRRHPAFFIFCIGSGHTIHSLKEFNLVELC